MTTRDKARLLLGATLMTAGVTHLTVARKPFQAQVPDWARDLSPFSKDDIVLLSGAVEIALGAALAGLPGEKERLGAVAAAFFTAVFPGNIAQYTEQRDGLGLNTDTRRFTRLFFQPALVAWALWCTRAEEDAAR